MVLSLLKKHYIGRDWEFTGIEDDVPLRLYEVGVVDSED